MKIHAQKKDQNSQILLQSDDKMNLQRYREIGRAMATVMSDEIFKEVPYKAKNRDALLAGIDKFLDAVTVLPPGNNTFLDILPKLVFL